MLLRISPVVRYCIGVAGILCVAAGPLLGQTPPVTRPVTPPTTTTTPTTAAQDAASARAGRPVSNQEINDAIKNSGLTPDQIRNRLRAAGYDPSLAEPYLTSSGTPGASGGDASRGSSATFLSALKALGILGSDPGAADANNNGVADDAESLDKADRDRTRRGANGVFGKDIFRRGTTVFNPIASGPVDGSYRLGVGDQLQMLMTGANENAYELDIRRDGTVIVPQVGQVALAGLTLDGARVLLRTRATRSFASLANGSATLDLTLSKVRTNSIFLIGEVEEPGAYQVSALSNAFHALAVAGGPTNTGSFRDVQIRRGGRVIAHMDLYDYLLNGDATQDIRLEQGDVLFVPLNHRAVAVAGAVRRPGIFELKDSEGLSDLLRFAGGLAPIAATERVQIDRILPAAARGPGLERALVDVPLGKDLEKLKSISLFDGDIVTVFSIGDLRRNGVVIKGEVLQPGSYELLSGMTLGQLIDRAEGLLPWSLSDRIKVSRPVPETGRSEIMSFDLSKPEARNFALREFDEINVLDGRLAYPAGRVTVNGSVVRDGAQTFAQNQTLKDVIDDAGGLRPDAQYIEVYRRKPNRQFSDTTSQVFRFDIDSVSSAGSSSALFATQPEDFIVVRSTPGFRPQRFVEITGLFQYPGQYAISEFRDRVSDVVKRAGGLLPTASTNNFRLLRSGRAVKIDFAAALAGDSANNPTMLSGDELYVGPAVQTVFVSGEVERPALVLYRKGMTFEDYVEQTGGAKSTADLDRAFIEAPNGDVRLVHRGRFRSAPEILSGSIISIPKKPDETDNKFGQLLTTTVQIVSGMMSLLIGYLAVTRK